MSFKDKVTSLQNAASQVLETIIRKPMDSTKDPQCSELNALSKDQLPKAKILYEFVSQIPPNNVTEILERVMDYRGDPTEPRKASPMDVFALIQPTAKRLVYPRSSEQRKRYPLPNTHKAFLECIHRCQYLEVLNISGMDDHATPNDFNDFQHSVDCREHYLYVLEDSIYFLPNLTVINLGNLATNSICKAVSETCTNLREFRVCGPCKVSDLGLRYIAGRNMTVGSRRRRIGHLNDNKDGYVTTQATSGCFQLRVLSMMDVEKVSLHTMSLLLIHLPELRILEHNHLLEALWLMHKTGMTQSALELKLTGFNGKGPAQCNPEYFVALKDLCPKLENLHLCMTFADTFMYLAKFRNISHLSIYRVSSVENFDLPLMAFGSKLVKLELRNCTNFQSGMALQIRKYCLNLKSLILEIDSTDANTNNGLSEAMAEAGNHNVWMLQNQVQDLQSRLDQLQITMLTVMNKYGPLKYLEEIYLKNLSMGSMLIIIPFAPNIRKCTMKYSLRTGEIAPNLSDALFEKIFEKNEFARLEFMEIWCKTLSTRTAQWFLDHCSQLRVLKNLSFWNMNEEDQIQLWRAGRRRKPIPVEIDF